MEKSQDLFKPSLRSESDSMLEKAPAPAQKAKLTTVIPFDGKGRDPQSLVGQEVSEYR